MASIKTGGSAVEPERIDLMTKDILRLEDPGKTRIRELSELARLFENDLITREEYDREKKKLLLE